MGWLALIGYALQLVIWVCNTAKEINDEARKQKTEAIQSVVRGIVDRDASRINGAFDRLRRIR